MKKLFIIALTGSMLTTTTQLPAASSVPFLEESSVVAVGMAIPSMIAYADSKINPSHTITKGSLKAVGITAGIGFLTPACAYPVSYLVSSLVGDTLTPAQKAASILAPIVVSGLISTKLYNYFSKTAHNNVIPEQPQADAQPIAPNNNPIHNEPAQPEPIQPQPVPAADQLPIQAAESAPQLPVNVQPAIPALPLATTNDPIDQPSCPEPEEFFDSRSDDDDDSNPDTPELPLPLPIHPSAIEPAPIIQPTIEPVVQAQIQQPIAPFMPAIPRKVLVPMLYDSMHGQFDVDAQEPERTTGYKGHMAAACAETDDDNEEWEHVTATEAALTSLLTKTRILFEQAQKYQLPSQDELEKIGTDLKESWTLITQISMYSFEDYSQMISNNFKRCNLIDAPSLRICLGLTPTNKLTQRNCNFFNRIIKAMELFNEDNGANQENVTFLKTACTQIYNNLEIQYHNENIFTDILNAVFFQLLNNSRKAVLIFEKITGIARQANYLCRNEHSLALYDAYDKGQTAFYAKKEEYRKALHALDLTINDTQELRDFILNIKGGLIDTETIKRGLQLTSRSFN